MPTSTYVTARPPKSFRRSASNPLLLSQIPKTTQMQQANQTQKLTISPPTSMPEVTPSAPASATSSPFSAGKLFMKFHIVLLFEFENMFFIKSLIHHPMTTVMTTMSATTMSTPPLLQLLSAK